VFEERGLRLIAGITVLFPDFLISVPSVIIGIIIIGWHKFENRKLASD
jgi:hypothetical protein